MQLDRYINDSLWDNKQSKTFFLSTALPFMKTYAKMATQQKKEKKQNAINENVF